MKNIPFFHRVSYITSGVEFSGFVDPRVEPQERPASGVKVQRLTVTRKKVNL